MNKKHRLRTRLVFSSFIITCVYKGEGPHLDGTALGSFAAQHEAWAGLERTRNENRQKQKKGGGGEVGGRDLLAGVS